MAYAAPARDATSHNKSPAVERTAKGARFRRLRKSREVLELLNNHLYPMLQTNLSVVEHEQIHVDCLFTGRWHSGRKDMARNHVGFPGGFRIANGSKSYPSRLPIKRIREPPRRRQ